MTGRYAFIVTQDILTTGETVFVVSCADLPGFMAQGVTVDTALDDALYLLREWRSDWPDVLLASPAVAAGADAAWAWEA